MKRNVDIVGTKLLWPDVHHMQFRKGEMAMYFRIKCCSESAFRKVDMAKRGTSLEDLKAHTLKVCRLSELKISYEKYTDLMTQLQYIAHLYQDFFKTLKHENEPKKLLLNSLPNFEQF